MSSVTIFQSDHFVLSTNFLFKFNVSLPLVTGELLQNTVDVNNVTYKLYNIKLQRLPVLLNTKNYLSILANFTCLSNLATPVSVM